MNTVNNWIEHLQHPLVLAGFGLFIFALLLRPLFLNNKKISGAGMERLLRRGINFVFILALLAIIGGTALNWQKSPKHRTQNTIAAKKTKSSGQQSTKDLHAIINTITIEDLRVLADLMTRDIIAQKFLYERRTLPVIAIKPIENKSILMIDPDIFQKTVRVKLIEHARGKLLFRDEVSHQYTLDEKMKQSGEMEVSTTTVRQSSINPFQLGQPMQTTEPKDTLMINKGVAETRVVDVDYFFTGFVYSTSKITPKGVEPAVRYFQFQFRLTDAQTNIIMWEKEYTIKRESRFI